MEFELRFAASKLETRAQGSATLTIGGYAAVFNSVSADLGGFVEQIAPGAFSTAIQASDTRAYWNHDKAALPLGRLSSGTLRLAEDETGLSYEVDLPNTETGRAVYEAVQRGDVNQSSFAMMVAQDGEIWEDVGNGMLLRTITRVDVLKDVSPVNEPAYADATVSTRALEQVQTLTKPVPTYVARRHVPADILRLRNLK